MSDTPETDAAKVYVVGADEMSDGLVTSEFARNLERERDKARAEVAALRAERDLIIEQRNVLDRQLYDWRSTSSDEFLSSRVDNPVADS